MCCRNTGRMFKQSFGIILIQIVGIILGFLSIYLVAGDMGPETYSLVGVYGVVSGIVLSFSHLGIETTMGREALYWKEGGEFEKIKEYTTQSIISRFIGFALLSPILIIYLLFVCHSKYDGNYLLLLLSFYIGSCAGALNNSMSLIIMAQGGYVFSQFARTLNSTVTKFLAIFVYMKFGAMPYLYFYVLIPLPLMIIFVAKIRKDMCLRYVNLPTTIRKIKDSKNLWLKSYLDYFSASADNLLISILFPPSIMGIYSLYKNLEQMAKGFIEGFFDVLIQKFVQFKGNLEKLLSLEKKVNIARWGVIALVAGCMGIFSLDTTGFIHMLNLQKYENVDIVLYCVMIVSIIYLIGKNEISIVALFAESRTILILGVFVFFATLLSFTIVVGMPTLYGVLLQRIVIFSITSVSAIIVFQRNRISFFTNINK